MPDPTPPATTATNAGTSTERIIFRILEVAVLMATMIIGCRQSESHRKIDELDRKVEDKSTAVLDKQDDAAKTAKDAAKTVKETLAKDEEERAISLGSQLYGNWRYLQDIADGPGGTTKDVEKAAEAKKIYNDHVAKHRKP
jgi:hypothetical protein